MHNTASAASSAFSSATGFDVEDMMVDRFSWFDYSTKRKNKLAEYAEFCDQEYPNYEIQGAQHKAYMKEIRLSGRPKAKVSHLRHPGTLRGQL